LHVVGAADPKIPSIFLSVPQGWSRLGAFSSFDVDINTLKPSRSSPVSPSFNPVAARVWWKRVTLAQWILIAVVGGIGLGFVAPGLAAHLQVDRAGFRGDREWAGVGQDRVEGVTLF
jgi:hypothetical protein